MLAYRILVLYPHRPTCKSELPSERAARERAELWRQQQQQQQQQDREDVSGSARAGAVAPPAEPAEMAHQETQKGAVAQRGGP